MQHLPHPFDTFHQEIKPGQYKAFVDDDDPYPLKGVTYPVAYGYIPGYIAQDGHELDVFVGSGEINGYILVHRPELSDGEHKIYVKVTDQEEAAILDQFQPVLLANGRYETPEDLMAAIKPFEKQL